MSRRDTRRDTAGHGARHNGVTGQTRATPSARCSAHGSELGAFKGLAYALPLGALLWALLLGACAHPSLIALDRAERMGFIRWQPERAHARLNDRAPWGRERVTEVAR